MLMMVSSMNTIDVECHSYGTHGISLPSSRTHIDLQNGQKLPHSLAPCL